MTHSSKNSDIEPIYKLLTSYSFEAEGYLTEAVIAGWLEEFGPVWVSHAITEALYQGRYKVVSIDQILKLWQRRGQPIRHFNREFESIILGQSLLCPTGYGDGLEAPTVRRALPSVAAASSESQADAPLAVDPLPAAIAPAEPSPAESPLPDLAPAAEVPPAPSDPSAPADEVGHEPAIAPDNADSPSAEIPNFRPLPAGAAAPWPQADIIQPFVPRRDGSEFHERLLAVVQGGIQE
ncbi:hypothetical protein PGN35_002645 [Nodosilinea sp. PGN35]|uniref:hypothetical protein n=1 Tax=Nodosilinea sp. PGN35 TaxID=3020489 RepID=UPI0023B285D5|nr:hypothetical protein [Nodosilinea sp. TSF1-S3]MDF0365518.1 hypothetical protein [Nodosilinea sp. TSF1-S3]